MVQTSARRSLLIMALAATVSLAGCAGTDVEFKGGIFEAAGLDKIGAKPKEKQMANRPGIVIPPSTASLPTPGAQRPVTTAVAANGEAFPVNPEDKKKLQQTALIAKHKAFCERSRERFEQGITGVVERSPWGECHESIMKNLMGQSAWGNKNVGTR